MKLSSMLLTDAPTVSVLFALQLLLLTEGLHIHDKKCPESLRPFHDRMIEQFGKMCSLVESEFGITVSSTVDYSLNLIAMCFTHRQWVPL